VEAPSTDDRDRSSEALPVRLSKGEWIRNERRSRRFALAYRALAALWLVAGAVNTTVYASGGPPVCLIVSVASFAASVGAVVYSKRCMRTGLLVGSDRVVIRNPLRTIEFPVSQVERFEAGAQDAGGVSPNATPGVALALRDGRRIFVWPLGQEGFAWNTRKNAQRWEPTAEALTRLLHE
jgi:hypothetical protein